MTNRDKTRQEMLARFADWNPAPVIRCDEQLTILMANRAAEELFGRTCKATVSLTELLPHIDADAIRRTIRDGVVTQQSVMTDEGTIQFTVRGWPERGVAHLYGSDITELVAARNELKESLAERDTILSSLALGIAHIKDFHLDKVNQHWREMFGYASEQEVSGAWIDSMFPPGQTPTEEMRADVMQIMLSGEIFRWERTYQRKDGSTFWGRMQARAVDPEDISLGVIVAIEDFSERKKMEDDLREAKTGAEEATKLKDKFVSLVTHDLRAPMATITGFLGFLDHESDGVWSDQSREILGRTITTANNALKMIESLLDISRLQTGTLTPAKRMLDLHSLAALAIDYSRHSADGKGVMLSNAIPLETRIYADVTLLGEVANNLVANAVKFTKKGGIVTISAPDDGSIGLAVHDTGMGVDPVLLPDLFKSEIKTTSAGTAGERGTGLGLPLCREIIEAHGGELRVESIPGQGSIFVATLPDTRPVALLVDHDDESRKTFREHLDRLGLSVSEATGWQEALSAVSDAPPHMIISDAYLGNEGGDGGFVLAQKIKSNPATMSIPVVLVTLPECERSRQRSFEVGADDVVVKPINERDFAPRVRRFMEKSATV